MHGTVGIKIKYVRNMKINVNKLVTKLNDVWSSSAAVKSSVASADDGRLSAGRKSPGSSFITLLTEFISELCIICKTAHQ